MSEDRKKGIKARQRSVKINYLPTNPKLKFVSKEEFLAIRKKEQSANRVAEEARASALAEPVTSVDEPEEVSVPENVNEELQDAENLVASVKSQISKTRKDLEKDPDSVKLKKRMKKLEQELNEAEDRVEELTK